MSKLLVRGGVPAGLLSAVLFCMDASAATDWPLYQGNIQPSASNSDVKAELPSDVTVTPPGPAIAPRRAAFVGIWNGWMCRRKAVDVKIAITAVTSDDATVSYAVGRKRGKWGTTTYAKFVDDELKLEFFGGSTVVLRRRPGKILNVKWVSGRIANRWCTGILSPDPSYSVASLSEPEIAARNIGRLTPQPGLQVHGPKHAKGLVVWSHGYSRGVNSANSSPQPYVNAFVKAGYDLYRFDRQWINNWASDAGDLSSAVAAARRLGYRRIFLMGQSAGAWVSLASLGRDARADGVIAVAPAHHGKADQMFDPTIAASDWETIIEDIPSGPRVAVVLFAGDDYDVGGRGDVARKVLNTGRTPAIIIDQPDGFEGHGAGWSYRFARTYGGCLFRFLTDAGGNGLPCSK